MRDTGFLLLGCKKAAIYLEGTELLRMVRTARTGSYTGGIRAFSPLFSRFDPFWTLLSGPPNHLRTLRQKCHFPNLRPVLCTAVTNMADGTHTPGGGRDLQREAREAHIPGGGYTRVY